MSEHSVQEELVIPLRRAGCKSDDEVVLPEPEAPAQEEEEGHVIPGEGSKASTAGTILAMPEVGDIPDEPVHIVILGDSTVDNYRYLNLSLGEQTVEMMLAKRCKEMNWEFTVLAMDGSTLDDVAVRQVPVVPDAVTHLIISASGNDLLRLLNEISSTEFAMRSMYQAMTEGLQEVTRKYRRILESLSSIGCHIACCTVYQPGFQHVFLKALSGISLGVHNRRIREIAEDLDVSVLDFASICADAEDFANPLELNTRGGSKVVENITQFVKEHATAALPRLGEHPPSRAKRGHTLLQALGMDTMCCVSCKPSRRIYADTSVSDALTRKGATVADRSRDAGPTEFAEAQEKWRQS